jgi:mannose/fructose/N-acetylgalactosamine-specific phosphotransferase system component IIC
MLNFIQNTLSMVLFLPYLVFFVVLLVSIKSRLKPVRAFGLATDTTTFVLFFAVPIAIEALFDVKTMIYFMCFALVLSMFMTYFEWRNKKEIELIPLLRKIWRFLFILLSLIYIIVLLIGFITKMIHFMN